jgi:hypothetical protein
MYAFGTGLLNNFKRDLLSSSFLSCLSHSHPSVRWKYVDWGMHPILCHLWRILQFSALLNECVKYSKICMVCMYLLMWNWLLPWRWEWYVSLEHSYLSASSHCITAQKTQHRHLNCYLNLRSHVGSSLFAVISECDQQDLRLSKIQIACLFLLLGLCERIHSSPRSFVTFRDMLLFTAIGC